LRDDIATTPLRPGERPVSEAELAKRFEVNRHTVGRTLDELAHERLIRIKHGRGSFVPEPMMDYRINPRQRFSE
jgi:GntR family phosphonate transport system transcriptional regulator